MHLLFPCIIASLLLAGCAAAYREPQATPKPLQVSTTLPKVDLYAKAAKALIAEGYAIAMADKDIGIITSQRREMSLNAQDVDLGSTMGLNYVEDNRTTEYVTVTIEVADQKAVIRADIDGDYLPNDAVYGKKMKGVSLGTIEAKIAKRLGE